MLQRFIFLSEKKNSDGVIRLKQSHVYYYQCQAALNITGLDWIDFVVYAKKDFVQRIPATTAFGLNNS